MPRESGAARKARAEEILAGLESAYPDAHCALDHHDPYQLLVATILSAQCTDARVNMVTPAFFARFPDAAALAAGTQAEVEDLIRSTGLFRNKGKNLLGMAAALVERHGGEVPESMDALRALPGVGRKTANVVLGNAFGRNEGITVDTHVGRIVRLLRLTSATDPEKVERDLMPLFPRASWTLLSHLLISHGRAVCIARRPRCAACPVASLCPSAKRG
ncbi:MAG TPA: endonuclease III [Gemmatimonadales bacterium]|nr:endonuclease III [Gemmatimonadales bacterium]